MKITYTYGDSNWKDKLTAYNGKAITYDNIGNPLSYDGQTFTWLGRRMMSYKKGSTTTSYKYNWDGIRTTKTVGSTTTKYFLDGSTILAQQTGNTTIPFYYDANGKRIAFKYNGEMYFYVYNLQGDVTHIIKGDKSIVGTYTYDAWGKITNINSLTSIAQINPFRYRGYYYDNESGLYYLNSRYYNPDWGRFINADGYVTTGQGINSYNMFAYCFNNPVMNADNTGHFPVLALIIIGGCMLVGGIIGACSDKNLAQEARNSSSNSKKTYTPTPQKNVRNANSKRSNTSNKATRNKTNTTTTTKNNNGALSTGDRVVNTLIGATLGVAVGGVLVAMGGAGGTVVLGTAAKSIAIFGATGAQTFAIGALAFDIPTMVLLPFFGMEIEPIEYSE